MIDTVEIWKTIVYKGQEYPGYFLSSQGRYRNSRGVITDEPTNMTIYPGDGDVITISLMMAYAETFYSAEVKGLEHDSYYLTKPNGKRIKVIKENLYYPGLVVTKKPFKTLSEPTLAKRKHKRVVDEVRDNSSSANYQWDTVPYMFAKHYNYREYRESNQIGKYCSQATIAHIHDTLTQPGIRPLRRFIGWLLQLPVESPLRKTPTYLLKMLDWYDDMGDDSYLLDIASNNNTPVELQELICWLIAEDEAYSLELKMALLLSVDRVICKNNKIKGELGEPISLGPIPSHYYKSMR